MDKELGAAGKRVYGSLRNHVLFDLQCVCVVEMASKREPFISKQRRLS